MTSDSSSLPFWQRVPLSEMTPDEWESLCDGCARCCLHKYIDVDGGDVLYTDVACRLLDIKKARCISYENRASLVPECLDLRTLTPGSFKWLPETCAYRLIDAGQPLPSWHPLVTGNPLTTMLCGKSVSGFAVSERDVGPGPHDDRVIDYVDQDDE